MCVCIVRGMGECVYALSGRWVSVCVVKGMGECVCVRGCVYVLSGGCECMVCVCVRAGGCVCVVRRM